MQAGFGTFSIFDHRDPVFRKALILFDRVVIPVPGRPIYDTSHAELSRLSAMSTISPSTVSQCGTPGVRR